MDVSEARVACLKEAFAFHSTHNKTDPTDGDILATAQKYAAFVIPPQAESKSQREAKGADER